MKNRKNMMKWSLFLVVFALTGCSNKETSETFASGFTTVHSVDSSRTYRPGVSRSDQLYYRPIDLDIWYPAGAMPTDTAVRVKDLLELLEQRSDYYTASASAKGFAGQLARFFCDAFKCSDSATLLNFRTNSFRDAAPAKGKYPLVIYMCAYNGMSYENFRLFEELSRKGFIVVSISSIGRFPGDMTMKSEDLMEQVHDAVYAVSILKQRPDIDLERVGIIGYSWGGLSAAILAGKIPHVKCLLSLEGSEFHHYGTAKEEDADFNGIADRQLKGLNLAMPYLRLESFPSAEPGKTDSVYSFYPNHLGNARIYTIDSMLHEDFDCFSMVVNQSGDCPPDPRYQTAMELGIGFLDDHMKNEHRFDSVVAAKRNITKKL